MDNEVIYLDNASTTKPYKEVVDIMNKYLTEDFYNPSGVYKQSQNVKKLIDDSREKLANILNCNSKDIFFTSCGTESNNWVFKGISENYINNKEKNHIIISPIEHHSILHCCEHLERLGFKITKLKVDSNGFINLNELKNNITDKTMLVSIIFANNEIGVIQNIEEIGKICKEKGVLFHTDGVQAFGHLNIDVKKLNIDFLSVSGHKFGGPKGIGFLYFNNNSNKNIKLENLIDGGGQEFKRRGGTENVASILGMVKAAEISYNNLEKNTKYLTNLRNYCINKILNEIPESYLNGDKVNRLPNNINIRFSYIEGESLVLMLNKYNICCSTGSACSSNTLEPSHVLLGIGLKHEEAHGSLRITLNIDNTYEQIDYFIEKLKEIVYKLRQISPLK